jgi:hypothetical protein
MPIEKVNMYVGYSCPIMRTNSFGMHTVNLIHGATSIIWLECCMLQIIILLLHSHKWYKVVRTRGEFSSQVTRHDLFCYGQSWNIIILWLIESRRSYKWGGGIWQRSTKTSKIGTIDFKLSCACFNLMILVHQNAS